MAGLVPAMTFEPDPAAETAATGRVGLGAPWSNSEGWTHDRTEQPQTDYSVVGRPVPVTRSQRPATAPGDPEPLPDGKRGLLYGSARGDELHANRHRPAVRGQD